MGKDLNGKELGIGISQRKDKLYTARFVDRNGKRRQKYFKKLQECQQWMADAQFENEHGNINVTGDMSLETWFNYWIENIKKGKAKGNTIDCCLERFKCNIKPCIGNMLLKDIKPLHCQNVLNQMAVYGYRNSSIKTTRTTMKMIFEDAVENEIIIKNPVTKTVECTQGKESKVKNALTVEEQKKLLEFARDRSSYYCQYAIILQTGIRVGELIGLKWSDVDLKNKTLHISRTMNRLNGEWLIGTPKSKAGVRDIPLTDEAVNIFNRVRERKKPASVVPLQYHDFIFTSQKGKPIETARYDKFLKHICNKVGIPCISMHGLRHTFATRCIEAGMQPKILQTILGHSSINVTMDIYVHVMEDSKNKEMANIESALKII